SNTMADHLPAARAVAVATVQTTRATVALAQRPASARVRRLWCRIALRSGTRGTYATAGQVLHRQGVIAGQSLGPRRPNRGCRIRRQGGSPAMVLFRHRAARGRASVRGVVGVGPLLEPRAGD